MSHDFCKTRVCAIYYELLPIPYILIPRTEMLRPQFFETHVQSIISILSLSFNTVKLYKIKTYPRIKIHVTKVHWFHPHFHKESRLKSASVRLIAYWVKFGSNKWNSVHTNGVPLYVRRTRKPREKPPTFELILPWFSGTGRINLRHYPQRWPPLEMRNSI